MSLLAQHLETLIALARAREAHADHEFTEALRRRATAERVRLTAEEQVCAGWVGELMGRSGP